MKKEIWKEIRGYKGLYEVSNLGRIKHLSWTKKNSLTKGISTHKEKILLPQKTRNKNRYFGYLAITLQKGGRKGTRKSCLIHRLVANSFVLNPRNKPFVNHVNGIKSDCRVENLEWCTAKENAQHAWKNKLILPPEGEKNSMAKLKEKDILNIRKIFKSDMKLQKEIMFKYKISRGYLWKIANKKSWKHI